MMATRSEQIAPGYTLRWPLLGGKAGLRADLAARYFTDSGAAAGGQALTDSTIYPRGLAVSQPRKRMHLRVADHERTIHVDTGRPDGQVIRIVQGGQAVTNAPVRAFCAPN
jgi:hypothetical protein